MAGLSLSFFVVRVFHLCCKIFISESTCLDTKYVIYLNISKSFNFLQRRKYQVISLVLFCENIIVYQMTKIQPQKLIKNRFQHIYIFYKKKNNDAY